jgi:hypothetical protein
MTTSLWIFGDGGMDDEARPVAHGEWIAFSKEADRWRECLPPPLQSPPSRPGALSR